MLINIVPVQNAFSITETYIYIIYTNVLHIDNFLHNALSTSKLFCNILVFFIISVSEL